MAEIFDNRVCDLGEGPIWHPERGSLIWFDINDGRMLERQGETTRAWLFSEPVSAAGLLDAKRMLVASASSLFEVDLDSGEATTRMDLEHDSPLTRSNDGRADPMGGFWIGTMGRQAQPKAGAIYRLFGGELRKLFPEITIPNSICIAPDGSRAYFTDTPSRVIWSQPLDEQGWPVGEREVFVDLGDAPGNPDGAVCDADGYVWSARWGGSLVVRHAPDGRVDDEFMVPASQVTCPVFGGADMGTLYVTTAREGLSDEQLSTEPAAGCVFEIATGVPGRVEPYVKL
ncbi:sugar lactone lactonase YvrE [Rubricella aquisinus]|uniref:Sugar lactone lactonase YvrE n=1 Tax=Rubricella aquisinus TaxID=2028108 RepID=A0A840X1S7_9RHOB|nr:SMP-30/gluconolactonase/LRE family protein [Rubricella aquisinus]MBB5514617.1 sugar lactone lactonase YvrE [Rubricella aquisinus]